MVVVSSRRLLLVGAVISAVVVCCSISTTLASHPTSSPSIVKISSVPRGGGGRSGGDGRRRNLQSSKPLLPLSSTKPTTTKSTRYGPEIPSIGTATTNTDGASIPSMIFSLVKSIVGAGVLGLPAGVATFGSTNLALLPAVVLIATIGSLSAYCFSLIGRVCAYTSSHSYRQAWERSVGPSTGWIPALACVMVTSCSVLAYSMILSDTLPSLVRSFTVYTITRTQALLGITVVALLPLCLMKSLKALGPFSLIGIIGMLYTSVAMAWRFLDGSYAPGGKFASFVSADLAPAFGDVGSVTLLGVLTNPKIFLLISMLSTAYMAHYNAPKFYWELNHNTLSRYQSVVNISFGIALLLFVTVASFGFATFGTNCAGLVLKNYSTQDTLMSLSRVAVAVSILFSYPLAFGGVRDGILDLVQIPRSKRTDPLLNGLTLALLTLITGMAYSLNNLSKLLAFNGATWGNAVIYLLPTYMFIQCAHKMELNNCNDLKKEVPWVIGTGIIGLLMGILGTVLALQT